MTMIQDHMVMVKGSLNMTEQDDLLMFTSNWWEAVSAKARRCPIFKSYLVLVYMVADPAAGPVILFSW